MKDVARTLVLIVCSVVLGCADGAAVAPSSSAAADAVTPTLSGHIRLRGQPLSRNTVIPGLQVKVTVQNAGPDGIVLPGGTHLRPGYSAAETGPVTDDWSVKLPAAGNFTVWMSLLAADRPAALPDGYRRVGDVKVGAVGGSFDLAFDMKNVTEHIQWNGKPVPGQGNGTVTFQSEHSQLGYTGPLALVKLFLYPETYNVSVLSQDVGGSFTIPNPLVVN
jgi:hypothetical protein